MICGMLGDEEREIQQQAGRHFPSWEVSELPAPPPVSLKNWTALIGPGLVLAGSNIGGGEWLFGPIVTARYGGHLMWLATLSILFQVFYNLAVMRYTIYTGEPIMVGFMRTKPGPKLWVPFYVLADLGGVWPYLAANAAVPLAAAFLGRLPDAGAQTWNERVKCPGVGGFGLSEQGWVSVGLARVLAQREILKA